MAAYLAAFAIVSGLAIVTTDTAFKQFEQLDPIILAVSRRRRLLLLVAREQSPVVESGN